MPTYPSTLLVLTFLISTFSSMTAMTAIWAAPDPALKKQLDGTYHLLQAERSPRGGTTKSLVLQYGDMRGKTVIATAACPQGCPPVVYTFLEEQSQTLNTPVFMNSFGFYIFVYDKDSLITVVPDKVLGKGIWSKFRFSNFLSKDPAKVTAMTMEKVQSHAIKLSEKIMTSPGEGAGKPATGGDGIYHLAIAMEHFGKKRESYDVTFEDGEMKKIVALPCEKCATEVYLHMPEFSQVIGKDVYGKGRQNYLIVVEPGLIYWARYIREMGKELWSKKHQYNVLSQDKQRVRKLLIDKQQQAAIDKQLATWSQKLKTYVDGKQAAGEQARIEKQRLPKQGFSDPVSEKQALEAANAWAKKYGWKETITSVYFTSTDWRIRRNRVTGIQLGREMRGVIVMKRPDGLCSFHYAAFAQQYDGQQYRKIYVSGIVPGQYKLLCKNAAW